MSTLMNRRSFLRQSTVSAAGLFLARASFSGTNTLSPNDKLNIGVVGVAHQGNYNLSNVASQNIVAQNTMLSAR